METSMQLMPFKNQSKRLKLSRNSSQMSLLFFSGINFFNYFFLSLMIFRAITRFDHFLRLYDLFLDYLLIAKFSSSFKILTSATIYMYINVYLNRLLYLLLDYFPLEFGCIFFSINNPNFMINFISKHKKFNIFVYYMKVILSCVVNYHFFTF